jgi:2-dehydropantoate 2-reductase
VRLRFQVRACYNPDVKNSRHLNILIAGLGALGTVFATLLKKQGHVVYALTRERYLPALAKGETQVTGIWGPHEAVLDGVSSSIEPLRSISLDLIIVTVKSFDTAEAVQQVKPLVGPGTFVLVAQNGLGNYETVSSAAGRDHTLLGRVIFGAKLLSPGRAEVTVIADKVRIGQPDNAVDPGRVGEIAELLDAAGIPTAYAEDITAILWDKVLYNAALNPLGALLGCSYGQLAADDETRLLMNQIIDEIFHVAQAHGVALHWKSSLEYQEHFYTRLVPPTAAHFPSMYYDLKAGKRAEIDALNGAIVRMAREKHIPVPANETVVRLIKAKEALARQTGK